MKRLAKYFLSPPPQQRRIELVQHKRLPKTRSALLKPIITFVSERQTTYGYRFTRVIDLSNFADGKNHMLSRDPSHHWLYVIKDTSWGHLTSDVIDTMKGVVLILSPPLLKQEPEAPNPRPPAYVTRFEHGKLKQQPLPDWEFAHTFIPKTHSQESQAKVFAQRKQKGIDDKNPEHHNNATDDMLCACVVFYLRSELETRDVHLRNNVPDYARDDGPLFDLLVNTHIHVLTCEDRQFHYIKTFVPKLPESMTELPEQEEEGIPVDPMDLIVEVKESTAADMSQYEGEGGRGEF